MALIILVFHYFHGLFQVCDTTSCGLSIRTIFGALLESSMVVLESSMVVLGSSMFVLESSMLVLKSSMVVLESSLGVLGSSMVILDSSMVLIYSSPTTTCIKSVKRYLNMARFGQIRPHLAT